MQTLIEIDQKIFLFLNQFHHEWLNVPMQIISGRLIWIPFVLFMLWTLFKSLPRKQFYIALIFFGLAFIMSDASASGIFKNLTQRFRPCKDEFIRPLIHWFDQRCAGRFGFVSSHAANSIVIVTYWWRILPDRKPYYAFMFILPLLVIYSRLYLGVHYPGDLLGGTCIGIAVAYLMSWGFKNNRLGSESLS